MTLLDRVLVFLATFSIVSFAYALECPFDSAGDFVEPPFSAYSFPEEECQMLYSVPFCAGYSCYSGGPPQCPLSFARGCSSMSSSQMYLYAQYYCAGTQGCA